MEICNINYSEVLRNWDAKNINLKNAFVNVLRVILIY
jgi:hypothetical protein